MIERQNDDRFEESATTERPEVTRESSGFLQGGGA
jgi:hypothetical protein